MPSKLFISLLLFGLWSCQSTQKKELTPITANLYVRYLSAEQSLRSEATFYEGDTSSAQKALSFPAGVAFLGSGMDANEIPGSAIRYETARQLSALPDSLRFSFQEAQQQSLTTISLHLSPIDSLQLIGQASLKEGLALKLPEPLAANESLLLLFTGPDKQTRTIVIEGPTAAAQTKVPGPAFQGFPAGTYQCYMVKKQDNQNQVGHLFINSTLEYYSRESAIVLQ